jgi:hypothetical protein
LDQTGVPAPRFDDPNFGGTNGEADREAHSTVANRGRPIVGRGLERERLATVPSRSGDSILVRVWNWIFHCQSLSRTGRADVGMTSIPGILSICATTVMFVAWIALSSGLAMAGLPLRLRTEARNS